MITLHRTLTILCCLCAALLISWKLLHQANYGYEFWYSQLEIESHISKFAPQNRQGKTGFERTDLTQRIELFQSISDAVNNSGDGLRTIEYKAHPEATPQLLLTDPEATHLEDVAHLIDILEPIGWAATALFVLLVILGVALKIPLPGFLISLATLVIIALILTGIIVVVGPGDVFSALHEAVFPADNPWFFYYQDSLMTTLMKAPDIFFAIGALWAGLAALIYLLITVCLRILNKVAMSQNAAIHH